MNEKGGMTIRLSSTGPAVRVDGWDGLTAVMFESQVGANNYYWPAGGKSSGGGSSSSSSGSMVICVVVAVSDRRRIPWGIVLLLLSPSLLHSRVLCTRIRLVYLCTVCVPELTSSIFIYSRDACKESRSSHFASLIDLLCRQGCMLTSHMDAYAKAGGINSLCRNWTVVTASGWHQQDIERP